MFNPKVPMFPAKEQAQVVAESDEFIAMMKKSANIEEWNINRGIVKSLVKHVDYMRWLMIAGYLDNVVFRQTFNLVKP